jgi:monoterpene epsilon-lactone hydrolase
MPLPVRTFPFWSSPTTPDAVEARIRFQPLRRRLRFYGALTEAVSTAVYNRVVHGKAHPDWPLAYEMAMPFLRVAGSDYYDFGVALAKKRVSPITPWIASKMRRTEGRLAGLDVEVHTPHAWHPEAGAPTVLFLHGGGYVTCSPRTHRDVIARIAVSAGARCIAPDYRLAPSHPFPAALDDALACYRALIASGVPASSLFLAGDSAGGGLSVALTLALRDRGEPLPRGLVLLSPWLDLSVSRESLMGKGRGDYIGPGSLTANAVQYAGLKERTLPAISPLLAELHGLPPVLLESGEWEILCEQNLRFADKARAAGVAVAHTVVPGMLHAYPCFAAILPQGAEAVARVGAFIRAHS